MPPPTSSIAQIDRAISEISDYEVTATLVGPDGVTPVQPAAAATLTATLISLEPDGTTIFANRDVLASLGADGAFVMPLPYSDLMLSGTARFQKRMLVLKLVQTNGKRRTHGVQFSVENIPGA